MQPSSDFDASRLARSLLRRSRQGALATLMPGSGDPYCSLVNVASYPDGSLMLDERAEGDPLEGSRIMLAGLAEPAGGDDAISRRRYVNAHPSSEVFVNFKDFSFFRIRPTGAHLVAGFGRIVDLKPEQFLTDISDAASLLEAEQGAVDHMNADHREAMDLYATKLLGAKSADWRCTGCDPEGIDLQADTATLRLDFPRRIVTPAALRQVLKQLADQARSAAGN
jgi:heme iron utilization protein